MPYQDELLEGEKVSIWVGYLESEAAVAEYIGQPFERDFGFLLDEDDLPHVAHAAIERRHSRPGRNAPANEKSFSELDVRELLEALTVSTNWIEDAEQACHDRGIHVAKVAMAFPHMRYRPELCRNPHAPIQYIGTFDWSDGRRDWQEKLKMQVISPPFPILRGRAFGNGNLFSWTGRVHLGAWKGFAKREDLAGEFMSFRFSAEPEGDLRLSVEPLDIHQSRFQPTRGQARAFQHLLENQQAVRDSVLQGISSNYDEWRESYYGQRISNDGGKTFKSGWELPDLFPPEVMPKLSCPEDLTRVVAPATVYVLAKEIESVPRIGFSFDCKWDEEHGLGVLTHKGAVVDVGQADTAFTDV